MRIRPAGSADVAAINALVERAYSHYVPRIGRRPGPMDWDYGERVEHAHAYVAEDAGELVGLLVLIPHPDHLLLENIAVEPTRQGEGIGTALLAFAEESARGADLSELRLFTNAAMSENLAFYPTHGYRETDRRNEHGVELVFFSKRLSA
jgi:N-acetylglutamate synthase-like GNAT family acetyltransferase